MKDLKSTFARNLAITAIPTALLVGFMALPFLESTRLQLATLVGLSEAALWLPLSAILLGLQLLAYQRSLTLAAKPLHRLMQEAEHGEQGFAFKTKAKTREEDSLKHAIESTNLRAKEAREQADELEILLEKTTAKLEAATARKTELETAQTEIEKTRRELVQENENLKASKIAVELTLENERKVKIGAEVEKRTEEIYTQMEKAVSAAAYKAIWIPSLVHELKTPISIIEELAGKLQSSWNQRSLSQVSEELERIHQQSQKQLAILNDILARQPSAESQANSEPQFSNPKPFTLARDKAPDKTPPPPPPPSATFEPPALAPEPEPSSPYELKTILEGLVKEFAPLSENATIDFSIDEDLEIEIEDPSLLSLLHALVETATASTDSGNITIGVDLRKRSILFDVACNGQILPLSTPSSLAQAEQHAKTLGGQIEVDATSETELHLSFEFPLEPDPADLEQETILDLEP